MVGFISLENRLLLPGAAKSAFLELIYLYDGVKATDWAAEPSSECKAAFYSGPPAYSAKLTILSCLLVILDWFFLS